MESSAVMNSEAEKQSDAGTNKGELDGGDLANANIVNSNIGNVSQEVVDIGELMAQIRERVKNSLENMQAKEFKSYSPQDTCHYKAGMLLHSEERRYLNLNFNYGCNINWDSISSHRAGILGKVIVKVKRKILSIVWECFKDYFQREREYNSNLVRFINDLAHYVDARDSSGFWELIKKIDNDVNKVVEKVDRSYDEVMGTVATAEKRIDRQLSAGIGGLQHTVAEHAAVLATLQSVASGLEGVVARMGRVSRVDVSVGGAEDRKSSGLPVGEMHDTVLAERAHDPSYLLLENRFRGSEAQIRERLQIYPPYFTGAKGRVLEIGAGRGELQQLFRESSILASGVDLDPAMVQLCQEKGLDVVFANGLQYLAQVPDRSLGGVIAVQVVEHLTSEQLEKLFALCASKVEVGGRVIFETINPKSVLALSSNYFRDPTHVFPQHPDTLSYTMSLAGLRVIETRYLSAVPEGAMLQRIPREPYFMPQWELLFDRLNFNIDQLNSMLYGHQDYCVVAEVGV